MREIYFKFNSDFLDLKINYSENRSYQLMFFDRILNLITDNLVSYFNTFAR